MRKEVIGDASIYIGDCIESMRTMPDCSINTCVTSPPYFGLRDYGHIGQFGLESTPDEYIAKMVEVFREVRRVLRDDGTLWLNIGDSYATGTTAARQKGDALLGNSTSDARATARIGTPQGCKTKDLIGIPWMLAFALRADGWYLRQDIIWHKPNPMPESVTDRCTKAHEYIFLLSKSERYHYDHNAIKERATSDSPAGNKTHKYADAYAAGDSEMHRTKAGLVALSGVKWQNRNKRSVWTVPTKPFAGAHFAVFPPDLIIPCILAGCPIGGTVLDPFGGSGTTGIVAVENSRKAILCELNPDYAAMAATRINDAQRQENLF